jgi:hypothetical protein
MEDSRIWVLMGLVLAVLAALLIVPEALSALGGGEGGIGIVLYAVGVVAAAAFTLAVGLPVLMRSRAA